MSEIKGFLNPSRKPGLLTTAMSNLLKFGPVVVLPFVEVTGLVSNSYRGGIISLFVIFFVCCIPFAIRETKWGRDRDEKLEELSDERRITSEILAAAKPDLFLSDIGRGLFGSGAWRLSLFRREPVDEPELSVAKLRVVTSTSSDYSYNLPEGLVWSLNVASPVYSVFRQNLADPAQRQASESDAYVGEFSTDDWKRWRDEMLGGECLEAVAGRECNKSVGDFPVAKFVWYGLQETDSGQVILLLAESASARGVETATLDHRSTLGWASNIVRISKVLESNRPVRNS